MSLVALGMRPSLHAAAQKMKAKLPVSITALYDKVNRVEPAVVRALVSGSAIRLAPVMAPLRRSATSTLPGWKVRIIDGNHLPASEKRIEPLRGSSPAICSKAVAGVHSAGKTPVSRSPRPIGPAETSQFLDNPTLTSDTGCR